MKWKKYGFLFVPTALMLTASTPEPTDWQAIGGSRADGIVRVAYEQHFKQRLSRNEKQAQNVAYHRCKVWGYTGAESFGGNTRTCIDRHPKGVCVVWQHIREYQCTDHHNDAPAAKSKGSQDNKGGIIINLSPVNKVNLNNSADK
ncbi:YecR family lipoprotein [Conchiformibius kuhniae]|uniref:YecR family lipoprotein n=1 Tax=Conchiformibius kuhniae TaxID=211502 RepID=A0A8T9MUA2_9NEIS|nr:YecR family lipoprotein [Conchiformibius kuhniae]UOP05450.1 YecR-like lipofamily protein [Conchiformibius kuhniae]